MTTLSTLIGPAHPSFDLGDAAAAGGTATAARRASLWQRMGGAFRRKRADGTPGAGGSGDAFAAVGGDDVAPIEALKSVVDDTEPANPFDADQGENYSLSDSVDEPARLDHNGPSLLPPTPPRRKLLWGGGNKRDEALDDVRQGIGALASLLNGIERHMEAQGQRQQELSGQHRELVDHQRELVDRQRELVACLSHLPAASAAQTQSMAVQSESLAAIRDQIAQGSANQTRLCAALERLGGLTETTGTALTSISQRIDQMDARDSTFTKSLERVSLAMETVSRASEASATVLDRVQVGLSTREDGMTRVLDKHQTRFTALMAVAIAASTAALAVVAGVGYLVLSKIH